VGVNNKKIAGSLEGSFEAYKLHPNFIKEKISVLNYRT
jgi:hypothetical protein